MDKTTLELNTIKYVLFMGYLITSKTRFYNLPAATKVSQNRFENEVGPEARTKGLLK